MFKKLISILIVVAISVSLCSYAFALTSPDKVDISISDTTKGSVITEEEIKRARDLGLEIVSKITDPAQIQALVDAGEVELSYKGELPVSVITYKTIDNRVPGSYIQDQVSLASSGISIEKYDWYDGRYFEEYDRYVIDGPSTFTQTYSRTSTTGWNHSMSGSVTVGGKVYGVAEVKAVLESSAGYAIGSSVTKTSVYQVNIPSGKYWEIKVWTSYRVFSFKAKVGSITLTTGKSWYPNGLVIRHTEYNI